MYISCLESHADLCLAPLKIAIQTCLPKFPQTQEQQQLNPGAIVLRQLTLLQLTQLIIAISMAHYVRLSTLKIRILNRTSVLMFRLEYEDKRKFLWCVSA
ncbi:uncharacterized protein ZBAI_05101 [Zygosaccharomyces bailii ISA1307]|nr:uncharacterized protein ZBAI_05101 [Zygosaccharomyces bailii ISA1307]